MPGGDWIDLYCAETVEMAAGEYKLLSLGISVELPEGYEAIVAPRSSTPARFGIICPNSFGLERLNRLTEWLAGFLETEDLSTIGDELAYWADKKGIKY